MRILGIDPGTSLIGYGIVDINGKNYRAVDYGDLKTGVNIRNADRVVDVYNFFDKLIKKLKPDKIALESLFFFKNAKTVIKVSEIRGVLLYVAAKNGIEIAEFTPLRVKQAVFKAAPKKRRSKNGKTHTELDTIPKPDDAADALALQFVAQIVY